MAINWPLRPNGKEVPKHRRSIASLTEGKPVFVASDWRVTDVNGRKRAHWTCGYCEKITTDEKSPYCRASSCIVDCKKCGKPNRITL
jgi:hypothetical protein